MSPTEIPSGFDPQGIRMFADALHQIAWVADASGTPEYFNASWTNYTGLTGFQSIGRGWMLALHPDDVTAAMSLWDRLSIDGAPFEIAQRFRSATGEYRAFRGAMFPLRDDAGSVRAWIGVCDEADLVARNEEKLRQLADALPVLVWATDANDQLTFVNTAWYDYTRLPAGSSLEQRNALVHPDDLRSLMTALRGGLPEVEFRLRRATDGKYRWHLVRWQRIGTREPTSFHRIGTAIDVHDERVARNERDEHLHAIAEAVPEIVWSDRADGVQDYANSALSRYTGFPVEDFYRNGWARVVHPDDLANMRAAWGHARATGTNYEAEFRLRRSDGAYRWFVDRAHPVRDERGEIARWFGICTDIDDQKRAVGEQAYLAELTRAINSSLDLGDTLKNIARLTLSTLCDRAQIDLEEDGEIRTVELARRDTSMHASLQRYVHEAVRSGKTQLIIDAGPENLTGMRSAIVAPLVVRGRAIGAISLARLGFSSSYGQVDVPFAENVAARAALAIENARLYQREHRVAQAMQAASLPKSLPHIPGVTMNAIYVPGASEAQIGGDWYDAFRLVDGRLVISIGDVAGSGIDAAVRMSTMRQIIRGTAQVHADPTLMLNAADRALRLEDPHGFVTAFVAVLDPVTGEMAFASAGHVSPIVRHANGELEELNTDDLPLGLREHGSTQSSEIKLADDDIVVFYTDGLVESSRDFSRGVAALEDALRNSQFPYVEDPARHLRAELLTRDASDDVAILTLRIGTRVARANQVMRWEYKRLLASMLPNLRREIRDALSSRGIAGRELENAELVIGELSGNVVRHAPGPAEILVDCSGNAPVLHVIDEGPGFERGFMLPPDMMSETGRGLYIVAEVTREFSVTRRAQHGSHARAVLAV